MVSVRTEIAAGTKKRVKQELEALGYQSSNTSAVERQNGTARRMNPHLVRKSLAFARLPYHRRRVSQLVQNIYNWCRSQKSLRVKLKEQMGRQKCQQRTPAMAIGLQRTAGLFDSSFPPPPAYRIGYSSIQLPERRCPFPFLP